MQNKIKIQANNQTFKGVYRNDLYKNEKNGTPLLYFGTILIPGKHSEKNPMKLIQSISDLEIPACLFTSNRDCLYEWDGLEILQNHFENDWELELSLFNNGYGYFLAMCLKKDHKLDLMSIYNNEISCVRANQILHYISGFLQHGEDILVMRNFEKYQRVLPVNFLPLTIDHESFRYWIFNPNRENIITSAVNFKKIISEIKNFNLKEILLRVDMLRKIMTTDGLGEITANFKRELQMDLKPISCWERKFSFVYQNLKGKQEALIWETLYQKF